MAKRRKVGNLLGLALLVALAERPMYPYEMGSMLRARGKDESIKINWGSLYTVIRNLRKHGFIEAGEVTRQGHQPERTVYRITPAGRAELADWLAELISVPEREYPRFEAALAQVGAVHPDALIAMLERRLEALDAQVAEQRAALDAEAKNVPRVFLIESEYHQAIVAAEAEWVRALLAELTGGTFPYLQAWRQYHETGQIPPEVGDLAERGRPQD
jgi:DNA-binding PadR family transcriptional regulator